MKVKICGITNEEIASLVDQCGCDFLGVVFYEKSPRFVDIKQSAKIAQVIHRCKKVAVVVEPNFLEIAEIIDNFSPDFFQFHGQITRDFLEQFNNKYPQLKTILALGIQDSSDLNKIDNFDDLVDYFLFDGKESGSGKAFDWNILSNFNCPKPWFLAGGLTLDNILQAIKITKANNIDISSGLEKVRGLKDRDLINALMKQLNKIS